MSRFVALALCVAFSCCALCFSTSVAWASDPPKPEDPFGEPDDGGAATGVEPTATPKSGHPTERSEAKILAALDDPTKVEVIETPLQEVIAYLKDLHGIDIQFDTKTMEDAGVDPDSVVTFNVDGISLRSALHQMLRQLDLTFVVRDGGLLITTTEAAESMVELRVYNAGELVGASAKVRELAETLRSVFKDNFTAVPFHNFLIVQTSQQGHEELRVLLNQMKGKVIVDDTPAKE